MSNTRRLWLGVVVAVLTGVVLSASAYAQASYDKGTLGVYVRDGRFVWRVPEAQGAGSGSLLKAAPHDGAVAFGQGDAAIFVRDGRRVVRVPAEQSASWRASGEAVERPVRLVDHYKHTHRYPGS